MDNASIQKYAYQWSTRNPTTVGYWSCTFAAEGGNWNINEEHWALALVDWLGINAGLVRPEIENRYT